MGTLKDVATAQRGPQKPLPDAAEIADTAAAKQIHAETQGMHRDYMTTLRKRLDDAQRELTALQTAQTGAGGNDPALANEIRIKQNVVNGLSDVLGRNGVYAGGQNAALYTPVVDAGVGGTDEEAGSPDAANPPGAMAPPEAQDYLTENHPELTVDRISKILASPALLQEARQHYPDVPWPGAGQ
jgi:hypothetical protein